MLTLACWSLFALIGVLVVVEVAIVALLVRRLLGFRRHSEDDSRLPRAAVVLAVRGPDPCLADTIRNLLAQQYPDFVLSIVVDDDRDPALATINTVIRETCTERIRVSVLRQRLSTCTLKCSALVQAVRELDPDIEVVAFIDGDSKPYPCWLRDLVAGLDDPRVGVVTGNRWYMPEVATWGSLVRYYWNAGAVGQMFFNGMVWAGSMALRLDVVRKIGLLDAWSRALSVDATVYEQVHAHGLRVKFTPGVMMVNPEEISLGKFSGWVTRQLVSAKNLGHGWHIVLLHASVLLFAQLAAAALAVTAAVQGNGTAATAAAIALGLYWLTSLGAAAAIEYGVRRVAAGNGEQHRWLRSATILKLFPAMLLAHFVYFYDLITACFCRRVSWRGVQYDILGRHSIRMVAYRPYRDAPASRAISSVV